MTRIVAVAMQKGGTGKTAVAGQVAWGLASRGYKTLVVDCDAQTGNVTATLIGTQSQQDLPYTTQHYLLDPLKPFSPLTVAENLDLVPANIRFATTEYQIAQLTTTRGPILGYRAFKRLEEHGFKYDFVICDCPPSFNLLTTNILAAAPEILAPVSMDRTSVTAIQDLQSVLADLAENPYTASLNQLVTYIPTFYRAGVGECERALELAQQFAKRKPGGRLSRILIPDATSIAKAAAVAKPIASKEFRDSPQAQEAFYRLVDELLEARPVHDPAKMARVT